MHVPAAWQSAGLPSVPGHLNTESPRQLAEDSWLNAARDLLCILLFCGYRCQHTSFWAQEARCQGEWNRWQEADKWAWDEVKRQHWAETLWRNQHKRRLEHAALRRNIAASEARHQQQVRPCAH